MSTIEERIVSMKFQGEQFLAGVDKSLAKLDQLNNKLKMTEGTKGLDNLGSAASRQTSSLTKLADGVQHISDKFKALSVVGIAALSAITSRAVFAGENMLKSLSFGPIVDGFHEYETNLNSIQTILSNTQAAGTKLKDVTAALDELNHYSDQTIYNFSEMARNIGTFTAAGVGLKPATQAIKGIANLAALSGSNSQQASTAMYQLSQAISSGRVSLEDWNSVVNAGMGGTVFQRALAQNAEKIGTLSKGAVKLKGDMKNVTIEGKSFRESITAKPGQESWLTSKVLTQTLAQFTGDLSNAALAAQGFNKEEIAAIQSQAKLAKNAATQVKTLTQLLGTIKESIGSGWAATWKTIFGDFPEAKSLFTNINNVLGGYVTASANARNGVLGDWKKMGGRVAAINAIGNTFKALVAVVTPIKNAFREIFPATTGKQLADFSKSVERFTKGLIISGSTADKIKRTFAGFFAILGIGWEIVKQVAKTLATLFGVATDGSGGFLKTTASVGDFLVALHKAVKEGEGLANFFKGLGKILSIPIKAIKAIAEYLGSLFSDLDSSDATKAIDALSKKLAPFGVLGAFIAKVWGKTLGVLDNIGESFSKIGDKVSKFVGPLGDEIANAFTGLDFKDILAAFNTGLFAGLVLLVKKFTSGGGLTGMFDNIGDAFDNLTGALGAMQNTLRAATLLQIAVAVGILAVSMNVLAKIDAAGLTRASAAITVMFTQLVASLLIFEKVSGFVGFAKMPFVATSMILLASAVVILSAAVKNLASLDWNQLAKGLTGVTVLLGGLLVVMRLMPPVSGMIATGTGLVILAAAIKILASAVGDLSGLSWQELAKGLVGVGALLGALGLFTKFAAISKGGLLPGIGLVLLAAGIKIMASAVKDLSGLSWTEIAKGVVALGYSLGILTSALLLIPPTAPLAAASILIVALSLGKIGDSLEQLGSLSWGTIGKGLVAMLGVLTLISLALTVIPPTAPLGAAALLITSVALLGIAKVLEQLGAMSWGEIAKSMVALALSLNLISLSVAAMTTALAGAAALLVVAAALAILAPVLTTLGQMSMAEIGKSLLILAGAFVVIGLAGAILTPVVPTLLGLGAAILLLGAGAALAGVGILALSAGLAALAVTGAAGTAALVAMVAGLIGLIPAAMKAIGTGIILFATTIATAGPALTSALTTVLLALVQAITNTTPKIVNMLYKMLTSLLSTMNKYVPNLVDAGLRLITGILNGIAKRTPAMVTAATNVVVAFINGVANNIGRVVNAGANLVVKFVNGVANAIRANSGAMRAAGLNLALAIIDGMTGGLASGIGRVVQQAKNIASSALNAAKSILGIHSPSKEFEKIGKFVVDGFRKGMDGNKGQVDAAFKSFREQLSTATKNSAEDVKDLTKKLDKLKSARHRDSQEIKETTAALKQAKKEHTAEVNLYKTLNAQMKNTQTQLGTLATKYDAVTVKLTAANDAYANAIKTRDDYNKSVTDQFAALTTASGDTTTATYIQDLQKQLEDTKSFANILQQLRKQGLNDDLYKQLLATGTSALPFVQDLLADGKSSINTINDLDKQLAAVAGSLGQTASTQLYQAAVDSAKGLVDGLKKEQAAIEAQMDKIADAMVKAIKKKLGIKSPSKVFAEIGNFSAKGLVVGLESSSDMVEKSAATIGTNAMDALRKSLAVASTMSISEMDLNPVIRPVLDLTQVKKDAGTLGTILPISTLSVDGAYNKAVSVSAAVRGGQDSEDPTGSDSRPSVSYVQNNYSPKALSAATVYRQTKNQLSKTKEALAT